MRILAHRGASADAPENTLPAFLEAIRQGADGVELDAMVCGSGEVVVCHDETLERLAGEKAEIRSTSLWALQRFDVGSRLGFARARIPLLSEVLDALPQPALINIELKCDAVDDRGLSVKVAQLVAERGLASRVLLSSFNPLCLIRAAEAQPELRRGFLIDPERSLLLQDTVYTTFTANHSVHPGISLCTDEAIARWHDRGLKIAVWTVDEPAQAIRLQRLGVEYCITNRPRFLRDGIATADLRRP